MRGFYTYLEQNPSTALPGASILEVGPWGLWPRAWEELELVANWRRFMDSPERYLR